MATIRYQLTEQEITHVLLQHRHFPYRLVLFRVGFGLAGSVLLLSRHRFLAGQWAVLWAAGTFMVVYSAVMLVWLPIYRRRMVSMIVRADAMHTAAVELTFHENGLTISVPDRKAELAWACFRNVTQDDHYFYLHYSDLKSVEPVPKNAFDAGSLESFLQYSHTLQHA